MEYATSGKLIIEFNGLPGSGKTTIAHQLKKELEKQNCYVTSRFFRKKYHRFGNLIVFDPKYWSLISEIFRYAKLLTKRRLFDRITSMVCFLRMYKNFTVDFKNGVLVIDQGYIQSFISLAHQNELPNKNLLIGVLKNSRLNQMPLVIVNCHISTAISNNRIMSRMANGCRVETMEEKERMETLFVQEKNFTIIRDALADACPGLVLVDISTDEPVKDNVEKIMRTINNSKNNYNDF